MTTTELSAKRSAAGRQGAYVKHSRMSGEESTRAANAGRMARFERQVDPDGVLEPEERARRATFAMKAEMLRISRIAAESRRRKTA